MKKRFLPILVFSLILVCIFTSCSRGTKDDGILEECIYSPGTELAIVYGDGVDDELLTDLASSIKEVRGVLPVFSTDPGQYAHSIVIGKFENDISKKAYTRLERLEKKADDDVGYVVYTDGRSIAVAYDEDICDSGLALEVALDYIVENFFVSDTLVSDAGILREEVFGIIDYQEAIDDAAVLEMWDELLVSLTRDAGAENADAIVRSLKNCYKLFNDDVVSCKPL